MIINIVCAKYWIRLTPQVMLLWSETLYSAIWPWPKNKQKNTTTVYGPGMIFYGHIFNPG